jgi:hypothetical protein
MCWSSLAGAQVLTALVFQTGMVAVAVLAKLYKTLAMLFLLVRH